MHQKDQRATETILNSNLNELAHTLLRELAMAAKKVAIYGSTHPVAIRALEKPFLVFSQIFRIRRYTNFHLNQTDLHVMNIGMKDSVFQRDMVQFMQGLDLGCILFKRSMTLPELTSFVDRFVKRVKIGNHGNLVADFLKKAKIDSIEVNTEYAFSLFEDHRKYRGDIQSDFTVKRFVLDAMGDDLVALAGDHQKGWEPSAGSSIDFDPDLLNYLLPEKLASFEQEGVKAVLTGLLCADESGPDGTPQADAVEKCKAVCKLLGHHPDQSRIAADLKDSLSADPFSVMVAREIATPAGGIKIELGDRVDAFIETMVSDDKEQFDTTEFSSVFKRLLRTGHTDKGLDIAAYLLSLLEDPEGRIRQRSLELLVGVVRAIELPTQNHVLDRLADLICQRLDQGRETYEYSELMWRIVQRCSQKDNYQTSAHLLECLAGKRKVTATATIYESMAVKKLFSTVDDSEMIDSLIQKLMTTESDTAGYIRRILIAIGSDRVAMALSNIISHPVRHVRQQALKILGELGKPSLTVFSQILVDDAIFERDRGRHELADAKWYIIRNSIFVLGLLKDREGINPLRLRISDNDVRVRREIIASLEKIGGEDACDLLVLMGDDPDKEIREAAVIAAGITGSPDQAPLLIDAARRNPAVATKVVAALGKMGGTEAEAFLIGLIEDGQQLSDFAAGHSSTQELRLVVVRALGQIGNATGMSKLAEFQESLSATQKLFFGKSQVDKAISEVLSRH